MTASVPAAATGNPASRQCIPPTFKSRKVIMNTSITQAGKLRPTISKIVAALAVASVVGAMSMTPAHGRDNDERQGYRDNGWHKGERHGDRDRRERRPVYQRPYYYSQPVYAPPPVYYAPPPSPGISLFLTLNIHIR